MAIISIITPSYNSERFIMETYKSVEQQTLTDWEWIICDDASTDNSVSKILELQKQDKRIILLRLEKNSGPAVARNKCLETAQGEYVAFLDADDAWKKTKLEDQLKFMTDNGYYFSHHNYEIINHKNKFFKNQKPPLIVSYNMFLKYNPFATSSIMIRRKLIDNENTRFNSIYRETDDCVFWHDLLKQCQFSYGLPKVYSSYKLSKKGSISANKKKMIIARWKLYRKQFKLGLFKSIYNFLFYATHGVRKYYMKCA